MPPKNSKKVDQKVKKIVEDKTFGMKNKKKSAKVRDFVQQVESQASNSGNRAQREADAKRRDLESRKKAEADKKAQLAELFKPILTQKVPFGVDPKTILCQYFKVGQCTKGLKCKFSHDVQVERKAEKINLYEDNRKKDEELAKDTMDSWDMSKLEDVISKKHIQDNSNKPTEIVCKYFIDAIESQKYGWFWVCPNGGNSCKYRHALPPGFVLKKKETDEERRLREANEKENQITLEEFLDKERFNLGTNLTPITYDSFIKWKQERKSKQMQEEQADKAKKAEAYQQMKAGMKSGLTLSGKELFDFNPEWAAGGDDEDDAMDVYERREEEPQETQKADDQVEIDEDLFENLEDLEIDDDLDDDE